MAFSAGYSGVFKIDDSGGSLRDISAYCKSVSFPQEAADLDTTTMGNSSVRRIGGLKDGSISVEGLFDRTATTGPDAVLAGALGRVGTYEFGPEGSTATYIKYTGECLCTSYEIGDEVDGLVEWTAEFALDGAVTRTTY